MEEQKPREVSRMERRMEKVEGKIRHYREKMVLLEMNFKTMMKDYVKYNPKTY